jgi:hypothetical protein
MTTTTEDLEILPAEVAVWEPSDDIVHEGCPRCTRRRGPSKSFCGIALDWEVVPGNAGIEAGEQECTMCSLINVCPECGWRARR